MTDDPRLRLARAFQFRLVITNGLELNQRGGGPGQPDIHNVSHFAPDTWPAGCAYDLLDAGTTQSTVPVEPYTPAGCRSHKDDVAWFVHLA